MTGTAAKRNGPSITARDAIALAASVAAPLAAVGILLPFRAAWSNTNVALLLVVVTVGVAALGNRLAGAVAAASAAAWFDFFFTVPYYRFTIRNTADMTTAVLLLIAGLVVSQLAARARQLKVVAITDAGYLATIYDTTLLTQSADAETVLRHVSDDLTGLLSLRQCRFEHGSLLGNPPRLEPDGSVRASHVSWDVDVVGMPQREVELRVESGRRYYGRFMMLADPGSRPSLQARLVAVTLANQAGRALADRDNATSSRNSS
jgi:Domain of unknown function (DUF4118)